MYQPRVRYPGQTALAVAGLVLLSTAARAQAAGGGLQPARHPAVCEKGVRIYTDRKDVPTPFDSVAIPAPDKPVMVTSPEEAQAAQLALRERAGSVGATGVLVIDITEQSGDEVRMRRRAVGLFVPSDSARAQQACQA